MITIYRHFYNFKSWYVWGSTGEDLFLFFNVNVISLVVDIAVV